MPCFCPLSPLKWSIYLSFKGTVNSQIENAHFSHLVLFIQHNVPPLVCLLEGINLLSTLHFGGCMPLRLTPSKCRPTETVVATPQVPLLLAFGVSWHPILIEECNLYSRLLWVTNIVSGSFKQKKLKTTFLGWIWRCSRWNSLCRAAAP